MEEDFNENIINIRQWLSAYAESYWIMNGYFANTKEWEKHRKSLDKCQKIITDKIKLQTLEEVKREYEGRRRNVVETPDESIKNVLSNLVSKENEH